MVCNELPFVLFQWSVYSTSGNRPFNHYHYRLYITTGLRNGSGTISTVYLHIHGNLGDSGVRRLQSERHNVKQNLINLINLSAFQLD